MNFEELGLLPETLRALKEKGFEKPTAIQERTIPLMIQGSDLIAQARTGSGKTAAFSIPIVETIKHTLSHERGVLAIVLVPTRELALQVTEEFGEIAKYANVTATTVYGGVSLEPQVQSIRHSQVVVGTPGRIIDHIQRGSLNLSTVRMVVLDEADRMLDMGFIDDVNFILSKTPSSRQTALFSATMPPEIRQLASRHLTTPEEIRESEDELNVKQISQYYLSIEAERKLDAIATLLKNRCTARTIVFARTKGGADKLAGFLHRFGFDALAIHGDLSQNKRERVLEDFKSNKIRVLVGTDVAARGLDIDDVEHVINYNIPIDEKTYVHRIGRTGRMGKSGEAITFVTNLEEVRAIKSFANRIEAQINELPIQVERVEFVRNAPQRSHDEGRFGGRGRGGFRGGGRREGGFHRGGRREGGSGGFGGRGHSSGGRHGRSEGGHSRGSFGHRPSQRGAFGHKPSY